MAVVRGKMPRGRLMIARTVAWRSTQSRTYWKGPLLKGPSGRITATWPPGFTSFRKSSRKIFETLRAAAGGELELALHLGPFLQMRLRAEGRIADREVEGAVVIAQRRKRVAGDEVSGGHERARDLDVARIKLAREDGAARRSVAHEAAVAAARVDDAVGRARAGEAEQALRRDFRREKLSDHAASVGDEGRSSKPRVRGAEFQVQGSKFRGRRSSAQDGGNERGGRNRMRMGRVSFVG